MITKDFEELILNNVLRGTEDLPASLFVGLCYNADLFRDMTMSDIIEVSGDGYTRLELPRTATGWLETEEQTDCLSIRSQQVIFSPTGEWTPFTRMFLCTASTGTEDVKLLAVSSPLALPVTLTSGQTYPCAFELYLKQKGKANA